MKRWLSANKLKLNPDKKVDGWFDSDVSFLRHVQNTCKSCFAQTWDLKCVGGYLTCHAALVAGNALVAIQLEY